MSLKRGAYDWPGNLRGFPCRRVRGRLPKPCVGRVGTVPGTDLGDSSKYSNETFED